MSPRFARRGWIGLVAVLAACQNPAVGEKVPTPLLGLRATLLDASVAGDGTITVRYSLLKNGNSVTGTTAAALQPAFTLAELRPDPVAGNPTWWSLVLTGAQANKVLPVAGPGTPPEGVLADQRQPGFEADGTLTELGGGAFSYTFLQKVAAGSASTHRAGLFLRGTTGTAFTSATLDFRPDGGAPDANELVVDPNCSGCHGTLRAHGGTRSGVRLCITCHTLQHADPDTTDPAAMTGATAATNPNPLDLGRLVHRIHRGKNLPTLYTSSSQALAPALPSLTTLPLPFAPARSTGTNPTNPPILGSKFSVVGEHSLEKAFGAIVSRTENGQPAKTYAIGTLFPRDLRDCDACHAGAARAVKDAEVHRRTCQGCHPDVWFGDGTPDLNHFAHPGGPQVDDTLCGGCHVPSAATPTVRAPIGDIHVPPYLSPRANPLVVEIVEVRDLKPGLSPTVVFTVSDKDGPLLSLNAPDPAASAATQSPVKRALSSVSIVIGGPTSNYQTRWASMIPTLLPFSETVMSTSATNPVAPPIADENGRYTFTCKNTIPPDATGTFAVAMEARRSVASTFYSTATDTFAWPYTGETVTEIADNPVVYVDLTSGVYPGGNPVARRKVVDRDACNACHRRLSFHGGRVNPQMCVICHAPDRTDWSRRHLSTATVVVLAKTWDNIEERSTEFKQLIHHLHTGAHQGSAINERPYLISTVSNTNNPNGDLGAGFRDDGRFPGDLARCPSCHVNGSYRPESVPLDAAPTVANETPTILHAGTAFHTDAEAHVPAVVSACLSCHDSPTARVHVAGHPGTAAEVCVSCHGAGGAMAVDGAHAILQ